MAPITPHIRKTRNMSQAGRPAAKPIVNYTGSTDAIYAPQDTKRYRQTDPAATKVKSSATWLKDEKST